MVYSTLKDIILESAKDIDEIFQHISSKQFFISPINEKIPGHYCCNFFFRIKCSNESKEKLLKNLLNNELVKNVIIVKGYLNITLKPKYFKNRVESILKDDACPNIGNKIKVNVEFCSVNPTGYLHIGHARNAILGDSIAKILEKVNYDVTKEYYVNDAGNQINLMTESILARFYELNKIDHKFPENGYKGSEMIEVAKNFDATPTFKEVKKFALNFFINNIKKDLEKINIHHDSWIFESEIINKGYIEKALKKLKSKNFIYSSTREEKKVQKGEISQNKLILLKTTLLGDDQDRPLTKSDGSWTYFAPDIGYHLFKIEREYKILVCVLGADHDSYAKRIRIATKLLDDSITHYTPICQMVSFENEGELVKFSKRMGNSVKISDFVDEISSDILRFMILEKSSDTQFVFNYEDAVNISMKNPAFYCQYAFARACSILRKVKSCATSNYCNTTNKNSQKINKVAPHSQDDAKDEFFSNEDVQDLIISLDCFKEIIKESATELAPHKLANYTKKLCEKVHKVWQIGKIHPNLRLILENVEQTNIRISIIKAFIKIAKECFYCLGIKALEEME